MYIVDMMSEWEGGAVHNGGRVRLEKLQPRPIFQGRLSFVSRVGLRYKFAKRRRSCKGELSHCDELRFEDYDGFVAKLEGAEILELEAQGISACSI